MDSINKGRIKKRLIQKAFLFWEIEVPGRPETDVVVAIVVPVVDVETLRIEVADVHAVTVRVHAVLPMFVSDTEGEDIVFPF